MIDKYQHTKLLENCSTIGERLAAILTGRYTLACSESTSDYAVQWCRIACEGDWNKFHDYIHWLGYDAKVLEVLDRVVPNKINWPDYLLDKQVPITASPIVDRDTIIEAGERINCPRSIVEFATFCVPKQKRQTKLAPHEGELWTRNALIDWATDLLIRLAELSGPVFKDEEGPCMQSAAGTLITRLPVLGRLWAEAVDQWASEFARLTERIICDGSLLIEMYCSGPALIIDSISKPLSDRHNYGQAVRRLKFVRGGSVIYKPRSLHAEELYGAVCRILKEDQWSPRVINRGHYAWMDDLSIPLEAKPKQLDTWQIGFHLAVMFFLGVKDVHTENVFVSQDGFTPIDLEAILSYSGLMSKKRRGDTFKDLSDIGILPSSYLIGEKSSGEDISVLRVTDGRLVVQCARPSQFTHTSLGNSSGSTSRDKVETFYCSRTVVLEGFSQTYKTGISRKRQIIEQIESVLPAESREFLRATWVYRLVFIESLFPENLENGLSWSLCFERLRNYPCSRTIANTEWFAELSALAHLDVPQFSRIIHKHFASVVEEGIPVDSSQCDLLSLVDVRLSPDVMGQACQAVEKSLK